MAAWLGKMGTLARRLWRFVVRVIYKFLANQGVLLAGSLAYNSLLSAIPLFAVLVMALSYFFDQDALLTTIAAELRLVIPGQAGALTGALQSLLENRSLVSGVGILVLLFFSSIAFRMLEEAIANIFHVPDHVEERSFWMSALIPYVYIVFIGLGIVGVTSITALLEAYSDATLLFLGWELSLGNLPGAVLYLSGLLGMAALFTSVYKVLPVIEIQTKRAIVGGIIAAVLWDVVRRGLVWYFASISLVNVIYGSLATVIIVLLGLEIGAIILLLGAQVIAELEHSANRGLPWYHDPNKMAGGEYDESPDAKD